MQDSEDLAASRNADLLILQERILELECRLRARSAEHAVDPSTTLQRLLDALEDRVALLDPAGRIVTVNDAWRQGREPDQVEELGSDFLTYLADARGLDAAIGPHDAGVRDVLAGRREAFCADFECRMGHAKQWLQLRLVRIDIAGARVLVKCRDINQTRRVLAAMLDAIVTIDAFGTVQSASDSVQRVLGYRPEDLVGRNINVLMPEPHRSQHDGYLARYRATGNTWILGTTREFAVLHEDGSEITCELSVNRVEIPGDAALFTGSFRDVTRRKNAETALRESERRLKAIFDQEFQFVGLLHPDGTLVEVNRPALEFIGRQREQVIGKPFWETPWWSASPQSQERLRQAVRDAASGEFVRYEVDLHGAARRIATIDFSLKPVLDENGKVVLLIPEGRDITELKRSQQAESLMLRTLASIGESAAMLAHELKSPITGINMALQALAKQLGEEHRAILADLVARLQRLEWMVRRTLGFAKPPELRIESCEAAALFMTTLAHLREILERDGANVEWSVPAQDCVFPGDPQRLEEVLASLIVNALEAKGRGAHVLLAARRHGLQQIEITVEDDGPGIRPDMRDKLFRPFVTDKRTGTGLGLVICRKVIEEHHGTIDIFDSNLGGAGFRILLPARRHNDRTR